MGYCEWTPALPEIAAHSSLRKYLSDPTEDVRVATENVLSDFLKEIHDITVVAHQYESHLRDKRRINEGAEQHNDGEDARSTHGSEIAAVQDRPIEVDDQDLGSEFCSMAKNIILILHSKLGSQGKVSRLISQLSLIFFFNN